MKKMQLPRITKQIVLVVIALFILQGFTRNAEACAPVSSHFRIPVTARIHDIYLKSNYTVMRIEVLEIRENLTYLEESDEYTISEEGKGHVNGSDYQVVIHTFDHTGNLTNKPDISGYQINDTIEGDLLMTSVILEAYPTGCDAAVQFYCLASGISTNETSTKNERKDLFGSSSINMNEPSFLLLAICLIMGIVAVILLTKRSRPVSPPN
jgi:hypothetical protein